jgi:chromosome partitioning protein
MIISILSQKGGSGKTTLALALAAAFARTGKAVLLVDADEQGSALTWADAREAEPLFTCVGMPKPTLHKELPSLSKNYDLVLVDGAPRVSSVARSAIAASDAVLVPVQPSPMDVWAANEIVELINDAKPLNEKMESAFVINRKITNTAIGNDVAKALAGYGDIPVLKTAIHQRVSFPEAAASGLSIFEYEPKGKAASEITKLQKEISKRWQKQLG